MTASILLVDDEPMVREELMEALEFEGFDVEAVGSVADALEICATTAFDVIITDLKMPKAGGLDLLAALKDMNHRPLTFVLSGHGAQSNRVEAMNLGALECFSKPIDPDDLIEEIGKHLPASPVDEQEDAA
ncbi:MAG: response regulator [Pseudomonadota bacterium]